MYNKNKKEISILCIKKVGKDTWEKVFINIVCYQSIANTVIIWENKLIYILSILLSMVST